MGKDGVLYNSPPQDTVCEQLAASQRKAPRHMLPLSIDGSNFRSLKMNGKQIHVKRVI